MEELYFQLTPYLDSVYNKTFCVNTLSRDAHVFSYLRLIYSQLSQCSADRQSSTGFSRDSPTKVGYRKSCLSTASTTTQTGSAPWPYTKLTDPILYHKSHPFTIPVGHNQLLCISTSFQLLRAPESWSKPEKALKLTKKVEKRLKKRFRPAFRCAQHPKAGQNTQQPATALYINIYVVQPNRARKNRPF